MAVSSLAIVLIVLSYAILLYLIHASCLDRWLGCRGREAGARGVRGKDFEMNFAFLSSSHYPAPSLLQSSPCLLPTPSYPSPSSNVSTLGDLHRLPASGEIAPAHPPSFSC